MKKTIFIPKKINVGFVNRDDTYTKKLAFVIYFDNKNILRQERSWDNWRDKSIEPIIYDNKPTEGFVLNKKVGGYSSGWNHRQTYCRIFDPRGFEFEITIENLLYILENTNSIKGKGLEGEFVYGWDGKYLVLLPVNSVDYINILKYSKILNNNNFIKPKDLILGATYKTKNNEDYIYMGRYNKYKYIYNTYNWRYEKDDFIYEVKNLGKYFYFVENDDRYFYLKMFKNINNKFIECTSDICTNKFNFYFDKIEQDSEYSPYDKTKDKWVEYTYEEFFQALNNNPTVKIFDYNKELYILYRNIELNNCKYIKCDDLNNVNYYNNYYSNYYKEAKYDDIYNELKPIYRISYLANGNIFYNGKLK